MKNFSFIVVVFSLTRSRSDRIPHLFVLNPPNNLPLVYPSLFGITPGQVGKDPCAEERTTLTGRRRMHRRGSVLMKIPSSQIGVSTPQRR